MSDRFLFVLPVGGRLVDALVRSADEGRVGPR